MTPIRRQYLKIKQRYPETILLFRLGDFYETFDEDARILSRELEIVLTSREMGRGHRVPMAGVPYHALDNYLARLVNKGYKVAICEQLSPPGKGLVEREVVRVVTPGTIVEPGLLQGKANNYLVSVITDNEQAGVAYVDITTSEFATTQLPVHRLIPELERLQPSEILVPSKLDLPDLTLNVLVTPVDEYWFELETAYEELLQHFGVTTLEGYGCDHLPQAIRAAGVIIQYLRENQKRALDLLTQLSTYSTERYMALDTQTRRNLELVQGSRRGDAAGSLLRVIDSTQTPMGGRLLKRWLGQPLIDLDRLLERQDCIEGFHSDAITRGETIVLLRDIADLERLINRVRGGLVTPKELVTLRRSLELVPRIKTLLEGSSDHVSLYSKLEPCEEVVALISQAIADEPPTSLEDGGVIKQGFSGELDKLRSASKNARQYMTDLEKQERTRTGIKSLKVGYNRVFGYYIEVTRSNLASVPDDYIRKQTLAEAERFFTPELKEYEALILSAQDRIAELESGIFRQICQQVAGWRERILTLADTLANIDIFTALADVAVQNNYIRPRLTAEDAILISGGRHPVVEQSLENENFISNDTYLSNEDSQLVILTGPNMAGKSTYLRQVALIVLLAQIGSFVPADSATIGLVDRIFTRIGAQEDIAAGQSTFMVEMIETANILNNATSRSLIILDEIGRGTSTYDGLSIAHAVAEYLHNHPRMGTKTLFATHYHELVELAGVLPRVKNFNVAVTEEKGKVVFLRKVIPGGADKSYGIHVAQLAGLPRSVLHRAEELLTRLESDHHSKPSRNRRGGQGQSSQQAPEQLFLFGKRPPIINELMELDLDSLTPLEAITKLYELRKKAEEG
ncbi:DNA mismatch repair protein MutS [Chloroflexota bacterium]